MRFSYLQPMYFFLTRVGAKYCDGKHFINIGKSHFIDLGKSHCD